VKQEEENGSAVEDNEYGEENNDIESASLHQDEQ